MRINQATNRVFLSKWNIAFLCAITFLFNTSIYSEETTDSPKPVSPTAVTAAPQVQKNQIIDEIELIGLESVNAQTVYNKLQSKKGDIFSSKQLEQDVQHLYETNLFTSVEWKQEPLGSGDRVKIKITIKESSRIEEIRFEGDKDIGANKLKETIKATAGSFFNEAIVKNDIQSLTDQYNEKGYYFASVSYRIEKHPKGNILIYAIRKGPLVKISDIIFHGNKSFPLKPYWVFWSKSELQNQMRQASVPFQGKELLLDLERIKNFYRNKGWLEIEVLDVFIEDLTFNDSKDRVTITIHINEGERYRVGKVTVTGNIVIDTKDIMPKLQLKEGGQYEMDSIIKDINTIKILYGKLGYIDCNVEIRTPIPNAPAIVDMTYQVTEGRPSYLEKVKIVGNDKTKDKVIRREVMIHPGQLMDYGLIHDSMERIANTRYFKDLNYEIEDGTLPDHKNITFKVVETTTGTMNFGGGYSSNYGLTGIIEYDQMNFDLGNPPKSFGGFFTGKSFAGGGQQLRIILQPGVTTSQYMIDFTEPYVYDKPVELNVNIFGFDRTWTDYREIRKGINFTLSKRFWENWKIGAGPRMETVNISDVTTTSPLIQSVEGDHRIQSLYAFVDHDTRDRWFIPHSGYHIKLSEEYAGRFLNGSYDFSKAILSAEDYYSLLTFADDKKLMLNLTARVGAVKDLSYKGVPFYELFYAGGFGTIRGFQFQTISPRDSLDPTISVGGNILSVFNSEITYPLYSEEMAGRQMEILRIACFYDLANVVNNWRELDWNSKNYIPFRSSIGYGFRIQIGMIPISFDIAYPIKKSPYDDTQQLQINMGYGF